MLEQVTPAKLDAYEKVLRGFHDRYRKLCWPLIYQADVRARLEQSERARRRGQQAYDTARAAGLNHEFQPNMPWEWARIGVRPPVLAQGDQRALPAIPLEDIQFDTPPGQRCASEQTRPNH